MMLMPMSPATAMLTWGCFGSAPMPSSLWALGGARVGSFLIPRSCWALVGAFWARAVSAGLRCGGALGLSTLVTAAATEAVQRAPSVVACTVTGPAAWMVVGVVPGAIGLPVLGSMPAPT